MITDIEPYLALNNYKIIELVQENKRKKTKILKVKKNGSFFIVKFISVDAHVDEKKNFISEVSFYSNKIGSYLPKLIERNDNFLILEFVNGKTLRQIIKDREFNNKILISLLDQIKNLYTNSYSINNEVYDFENGISNLSNLLVSGPIQKSFLIIPLYKKYFFQIVLIVLKFKFKRYLKHIDFKILKKGFVHGDFHYNNIIIDKKSNIKFIDFERTRSNGYFDFDIMYLIAMLEINLNDNSEELEKLNKAKIELFNNDCLIDIYNLFRFAVKLNIKFLV